MNLVRSLLVRPLRGSRLLLITTLLTLAIAGNGAAQTSTDAIWQAFVDWLPSSKPAGNPGPILEEYGALLISKGASAEEAKKIRDIVSRTMRERTDAWRIMFNRIYAGDKPGFTVQPNALLVSTIDKLKPGRALDIGMGQGRNAVFLAMKGWDVTGFDISDHGLSVARGNAERAGVKLNAVLKSNAEFDFGADQWDLLVFMYEPFPITSAAYVERLRRSIKVGGHIVIESFSESASTPNQPATAIDPANLLEAFKPFRVVHFEDVIAQPDWGPDKRRVVRMVAERTK